MRKRFLYNMNSCIGCGSCQVACKDKNGLLPGEYFRRVTFQTAGLPGEDNQIPFSISCNHCEEPACASVCPTGAMYQSEEGIVLHNDSLCIGCGRCYWNCPYGEVSFGKTKGLTQKCDTCIRRREQGYPTACEAACPTGSLRFGEIAAEEGELPDLSFLPDPELTKPSLRIIRPKKWREYGHVEDGN